LLTSVAEYDFIISFLNTILATLSFINGERSHTATNRKPPTGRGNEQDPIERYPLDLTYSLQCTQAKRPLYIIPLFGVYL